MKPCARDSHKVVAVDELRQRYLQLKRDPLPEEDRGIATRELVVKVRALSAVRRDRGLQSVFRHACGGETGLFQDPAGKAYMSGGFDDVLHAMMMKTLLAGADAAEAAYFHRSNTLAAEAFSGCADYRPEVGQKLRQVSLDAPDMAPEERVVQPAPVSCDSPKSAGPLESRPGLH